MATLFDLSVIGPPPGGATVATELWIDMGVIPSGFKLWFGNMKISAAKSVAFELRTNNLTKSTGTLANTTLLYKASVTPKAGLLAVDMYKNGRLHTASVLGSGTEKWWIRLVAKGSAAIYGYQIYYTTE